LALYARATELAKQSTSEIKSPSGNGDGPAKLSISSAQLKALSSYLTSLVLQHRGLAELLQVDRKTKNKDKILAPPMIERLHHNQYEEDIDLENLVNYPPKLQPIPVKPLFFDLAWNYIQYPGQVEKSNGDVPAPASDVKQEEKPAKKGWFGFGRS
jgi:signal recognition particle subunit SRP68